MALYSFPPTLLTLQAPVTVPLTVPVSLSTLKAVNDIPLTRSLLKRALRDLSERLYYSFRRQVRLVVHGGAVMVLHPSLRHRESTQDVDYIHRSFVTEYRDLGFPDPGRLLRKCIAETALKYNLGADWMNDHADVALPMARDHLGQTYDPIYYASIQRQNAEPQTIFSDRGLALVGVPWPWAIALKLVRYMKQDPVDCAAILRLGAAQRGIQWTLSTMEQWISERCWPMGYNSYQPPQKVQLRQRIQDALNRAFPSGLPPPNMPPHLSSSSSQSSLSSHTQCYYYMRPSRKTSDIPLYFS